MHIKNSLYSSGKRADFSLVTVFYSNKLYKTLHYNLKKAKLNKINKINTYENRAVIKGGKAYIRTDIIQDINSECEIKNQNKYILIKEST